MRESSPKVVTKWLYKYHLCTKSPDILSRFENRHTMFFFLIFLLIDVIDEITYVVS